MQSDGVAVKEVHIEFSVHERNFETRVVLAKELAYSLDRSLMDRGVRASACMDGYGAVWLYNEGGHAKFPALEELMTYLAGMVEDRGIDLSFTITYTGRSLSRYNPAAVTKGTLPTV